MPCPTPPLPTRRRAFTLTELLVIVAVLGIASALVLPRLGDQDVMQLRRAATLLAADLDAAKAGSLTHADDPRLVVFDADANAYHVAAASDPATPVTNPFDRRPYRVVFGSGRAAALGVVSLDAWSLNGDDAVGFGVYGQLDQATPATVTLRAGDTRLTLTLDPDTGEASIGDLH
ncbi:MAG: type II secretion system protein [Planctomycetota bacterium]